MIIESRRLDKISLIHHSSAGEIWLKRSIGHFAQLNLTRTFLPVFEKLIKYMHFAISLLLLFKGTIGDHQEKKFQFFKRG